MMFGLRSLVRLNLRDERMSEEPSGGRRLEGPGMGAILGSEKDRTLFFKLAPYWGTQGKQLAAKLRGESNVLEQDPATQEWSAQETVLEDLDIALVTEWRQEFLRRKEMAVQAEKLCTPDVISEAASSEPLFQRTMEVMGARGGEKLQQIITSQIEEMAFGVDIVYFEGFVQTLERVADMQKREQTIEGQIDMLVAKHGLSTEVYQDIINTQDPQIRSELLYKVIHENKGLFQRLRPGRSVEEGMELHMTEERLQMLQAETDVQLQALGGILGMLRKSAPDMQKLISRAILNPDVADADVSQNTKAELSLDEAFGEVRAQAPRLQNYAESWKLWKEQNQYDILSSAEQEDTRDQYLDTQFRGGKPKKGVFRSTYAFIKRVLG